MSATAATPHARSRSRIVPPLRHEDSALRRSGRAPIVTFSGLQGGAGTSTAALLLATAVTQSSARRALAADLAGATAGGLGGLASGWSQVPARTLAQLVLEHGQDRAAAHTDAPATLPIARPYITTPAGVHVISAPPTQHAQDDCDEDGQAALTSFLTRARDAYSLIAVDVGVADCEALRPLLELADLHVLVVAARREDLACVRARLASRPRTAAREALLAWPPAGGALRRRDLRTLSEERGCPLVKWPTAAWNCDWRARAARFAPSLEVLCRLLPSPAD
jgi:hypothetical protein